MTNERRLRFRGVLVPQSFVAFMRHRADRLSLGLQIERCDHLSATVTVGGQSDLVDAFEVACSLGPADCRIDAVDGASATP